MLHYVEVKKSGNNMAYVGEVIARNVSMWSDNSHGKFFILKPSHWKASINSLYWKSYGADSGSTSDYLVIKENEISLMKEVTEIHQSTILPEGFSFINS